MLEVRDNRELMEFQHQPVGPHAIEAVHQRRMAQPVTRDQRVLPEMPAVQDSPAVRANLALLEHQDHPDLRELRDNPEDPASPVDPVNLPSVPLPPQSPLLHRQSVLQSLRHRKPVAMECRDVFAPLPPKSVDSPLSAQLSPRPEPPTPTLPNPAPERSPEVELLLEDALASPDHPALRDQPDNPDSREDPEDPETRLPDHQDQPEMRDHSARPVSPAAQEVQAEPVSQAPREDATIVHHLALRQDIRRKWKDLLVPLSTLAGIHYLILLRTHGSVSHRHSTQTITMF